MSETFRGGESYFQRADQELPDYLLEAKATMLSIEKILAKLVEQSGDLPDDVKQSLRAQLAEAMASLGATTWEEYYKITDRVYREMNNRLQNPIAPNYPSRDDFALEYHQLLTQNSEAQLFPTPYSPTASEVAALGQYEWREIEGRSAIPIIDYTYNLGRVMADRVSYGQVFEPGNAITIDSSWHIENGCHRALSLKILGEDYVSHIGMDNWVEVQQEI